MKIALWWSRVYPGIAHRSFVLCTNHARGARGGGEGGAWEASRWRSRLTAGSTATIIPVLSGLSCTGGLSSPTTYYCWSYIPLGHASLLQETFSESCLKQVEIIALVGLQFLDELVNKAPKLRLSILRDERLLKHNLIHQDVHIAPAPEVRRGHSAFITLRLGRAIDGRNNNSIWLVSIKAVSVYCRHHQRQR